MVKWWWWKKEDVRYPNNATQIYTLVWAVELIADEADSQARGLAKKTFRGTRAK